MHRSSDSNRESLNRFHCFPIYLKTSIKQIIMGCGSSKPSNSAVVQSKIDSGEYDTRDYDDRKFGVYVRLVTRKV